MTVHRRGRQYFPVISLTREDAIIFAQSIFQGEPLSHVLHFDEDTSEGTLLSPGDSSVLSTFRLCEVGEHSRVTLYPLQ